MKLCSRKWKRPDPLEEGTKYLAYTQSEILEHHYNNAVPGSIKLSVTVQAGQVITEISYLDHNGNTFQKLNVEAVDDVLEDD